MNQTRWLFLGLFSIEFSVETYPCILLSAQARFAVKFEIK